VKRRELFWLIGAAFAWPHVVIGQPTARYRKIGILVGQDATDPEWLARFGALSKALRELGWVEGNNFAFEIRHAVGKPDQFSAMAAELVSAGVDVLVVAPAGLAVIARRATSVVPIIVMSAGDLETSGLVASVSKPGGNVTGFQLLNPELMSKRLDLMRQIIPNLSRIGFLEPITPSAVITPRYLNVTIEAARALQIEVHRVQVHNPNEFTSAFAAMARAGDQAVIVISNPLSSIHRNEVVKSAAQSGLPTIYELRMFAIAGGLLSYGADLVQLAADASRYVDKVLKGASPADLPVQQPTKFELVINLKTAKTLGLAIPPSLLASADEVIE
jgi:putative tryptophan/tyrosine transport system substrate-binding protein